MGVFVLALERASRESLFFFLFSLVVAAWLFSFSLMYVGPDLDWAALWARTGYLAVPLIAPAAYHFALTVARRLGAGGPLVVMWGLGVGFTVVALTTDLLLADTALHPWGPYPVYGPAGAALAGFVMTVFLLLIWRLWREARLAGAGVHRRRMQGMALAFGIAALGGVDFLPKFGVGVPPLGFVAYFGFLLVSGVVIYRYRLVDYTPSLAASEVLNTMADALLVTDLEGRIRLTNPAVETVVGYDGDELEGRTLHEVEVRPEDSDAGVLDHAPGELRDVVSSFRTPSGQLKEVSISTSPLSDDSGRDVGWVVLLRDVTERRSLEEQLRHSQKLEAVGRLAGGIAHDFNNLLTAMTGNARFVMDDLPGDTPARRELELLMGTLERASTLTRQLLTFSRKGEADPTVIRLGAVARDMEGMLGRLVGEDVELEIQVSQGEPPVKADQGRMEQVILNLVVNARDAMPDGGRVSVSVDSTDLPEPGIDSESPDLPEGRYVRLTVRDSGIGMAEATRSRVFEPFFSTKDRETGSGLGLATVYGIVTQAGGDVAVASKPGAGSTFTVHLPAVEAPDSAASEPPGSSPEGDVGAGETVLVVEDDDAVRRVMRRALEQSNHRVLEASGAEDALSLLEGEETRELRAIVTDAVMPGMTGPKLLRELRERGIGIPAVLVSGYAEEEIQRQGGLPDGVAVLAKPFDPEVLVQRVRELMAAKAEDPGPGR